MKAVILAGGKGTRLAPYNTVFPKPLVPLGDRPILDIVIHQLAHHGFDEIVLSVGYLAELIEAYYHQGRSPRKCDAKITFVRETEPLGTVGSLALVDGLDEPFLVMNGDILTTLDYTALMRFHREKEALLTIALNRRPVKIDLGVIEIDSRQRVTTFVEKPTLEYLVSMGVYVYDPSVVKYIERGKYLDFPQLVWKLLADKKECVAGFPNDAYWLDLGSHTDYKKAQDEFEQMRAKLLPHGD